MIKSFAYQFYFRVLEESARGRALNIFANQISDSCASITHTHFTLERMKSLDWPSAAPRPISYLHQIYVGKEFNKACSMLRVHLYMMIFVC